MQSRKSPSEESNSDEGLAFSKMLSTSRHQMGLQMLGVVGEGKPIPTNNSIDVNTGVSGI